MAHSAFYENLRALRRCLLLCLSGLVLTCIALAPFMQELFKAVSAPLIDSLPERGQLIAVGVISPVTAPLEVLFLCAAALSLPNTLYQIWRFIAPGLYKKERLLALLFVISGLLMFIAGGAYCFFVVLRLVLGFVARTAPDFVSFAPDIASYISFSLHLMLAFALSFETPLIVLILTRFGIVSLSRLKKARRYVILICFVVSAIVTPPDVLSQLLLALPLIALFELGLIASALGQRRRKTLAEPA